MKRGLLVTLPAVLLLAGCGSGRSVLTSGVQFGVVRTVIVDTTALRDGKRIRKHWLAEIARQARADPTQRFRNLTAAQFRRRLDVAASRYGFQVKSMRFLRPREVAPLVVLRTRHYVAFSRSVPTIEKSLDPGLLEEPRHAAFEAFYLEGDDERGVPFVIVTSSLRGQVSGGQWARAEVLFPYAHG